MRAVFDRLKTDVPPLEAARGDHARRTAIGVNGRSVNDRCRKNPAVQGISGGTCGCTHADSCARVTPYCSFFFVGYDISCGSCYSSYVAIVLRKTFERFLRSARAKGFCRKGFFETICIASAARDRPARREGK